MRNLPQVSRVTSKIEITHIRGHSNVGCADGRYDLYTDDEDNDVDKAEYFYT
jgi:hypothetical protein